jgi:opacity protein-like surface antigen
LLRSFSTERQQEVEKAIRTLAVLLLTVSTSAFGQKSTAESKNEFGFSIGGELIPGNSTLGPPAAPINFSSSVIFQLHYARRLKQGKHLALYFEVPAAAAPSHVVESTNAATPVNLATFFVTPSFRVNFKPASRVSPWLSFGGGYGLYEGSEGLRNLDVNPDRFTNTAALQWGAGVDYKTSLKVFFPISLRGEIRDFYTLDTLNFNNAITNNRQHNVAIGGGFFWRF